MNGILSKIACFAVAVSAAHADSPAAPAEEKLNAVLSSYGMHLSSKLTPDGRWFVYSVVRTDKRQMGSAPGKSEVVVVVRSTEQNTEHRYLAGERNLGAGGLEISPSGRWLAFIKAPDVQAGPRSTDLQTTVVVVEIATGRTVDYANCRGFLFAGQVSGPEWIVLHGYAAGEAQTFDLTVHDLGKEQTTRIEAVSAFVLNPPGTRVAWVDEQGLHEYEFATERRRILDAGGKKYLGLTWSAVGNALAALRAEGSSYTLMTVTGLKSKFLKKVFSSLKWKGFPQGYEISPDVRFHSRLDGDQALLSWRQDEGGVFFRVRTIERSEPAAGETVPNLVLWHWRDKMPPQGEGKKRRDWQPAGTDLCFVSIADARFVRLGDASLSTAYAHGRGQRVLGFDSRSYSDPKVNNPSEAYFQGDYYLVNLQTGGRTLAIKGLWVTLRGSGVFGPPRLSPDGSVVLYQGNDGDYYSYETATGRRRNLTAGLPRKFYYEEDLKARSTLHYREESPAFQGWSANGQYALISDRRDVWALGLKGRETLNLTGNGWQDGLVYKRSLLQGWAGRQQWENRAADPNEPVYFYVRNLKTGDSGLARRVLKAPQLEMLRWEAANVVYFKAERAAVYLSYHGTAGDSGDYYLLDADWRPAVRLTDINPQQRELGIREPLYLSYPAGEDEIRYAVLQLPLDRDIKPPYPTVVNIYEYPESGPHAPSLGIEASIYLQNGYAVLHPYIQPRINEAGQAAVEGVRTAVDAAVASGMADRERLGLTGHSFGGYETNFVISQTNLFKAAVAEAGPTDILNQCNRVYPSGQSSSVVCAAGQMYMSDVRWWENLPAYVDNSPLYHARNIDTPLLIVQGDQDISVPFAQTAQLFNTLYYMGNKQVVLLQYVGAGHLFSDADTHRDIRVRMLQFFDHFLRGAPAPKWWAEGLSYTQGQVPAVSQNGMQR